LRLQVRNAPMVRQQVQRNDPVKVFSENVVVRDQQRPVDRNRGKILITQENTANNESNKVVKNGKRPVVVDKITRTKEIQRDASLPVISTDKKQGVATSSQKSQMPDDDSHKQEVSKKKEVTSETVARNQQLQKSHTDTQIANESRSTNRIKAQDHIAQDKRVKLIFAGGTITVNNKQGKLREFSVNLQEGETRNITLVAKGGLRINMPISYRNGMLMVARDVSQFTAEPSWNKGKSYKINTEGVSHLDNVKLTVKTI
jgi:hypothetical protein